MEACLLATLEENFQGSCLLLQTWLFCTVFPNVTKASSVGVLPEAVAADARDLCASIVVCLWPSWSWEGSRGALVGCLRMEPLIFHHAHSTLSAQTCLLGRVCYLWVCFDGSGLRWHKMSALTNKPAVLCDLWAAEETGFVTGQDCMRHPLKMLTSEIAKLPVFPTASHCLARHRLGCEQQVRAGLSQIAVSRIGRSAPNV